MYPPFVYFAYTLLLNTSGLHQG